MAERQSFTRPDSGDRLASDVRDLFRVVRRVAGRQNSGRVGSTPIVVEAFPTSGDAFRVRLRNETTGATIDLGEL